MTFAIKPAPDWLAIFSTVAPVFFPGRF